MKPQARTDPGRPLATELLQLLASAASTQSSTPADARSKVDALLDQLIGLDSLKFNEQLLQGGPWRVLYTRGSVQLWKATYSAGKLVKSSNAASQDLDPATRSVLNKAEYLGDKLWVTASGTYTPLDDSPSLPKPIQANISSGCIHVFGVDIPLPIRGTGLFEVVYLDERVRVFRSGGALAVQVKEEYLREQGLL